MASGRKSKSIVLSEDEARKREIRRQRNRNAAEKCKLKRSCIEENLNNDRKRLSEENANLLQENEKLLAKKRRLEEMLNSHPCKNRPSSSSQNQQVSYSVQSTRMPTNAVPVTGMNFCDLVPQQQQQPTHSDIYQQQQQQQMGGYNTVPQQNMLMYSPHQMQQQQQSSSQAQTYPPTMMMSNVGYEMVPTIPTMTNQPHLAQPQQQQQQQQIPLSYHHHHQQQQIGLTSQPTHVQQQTMSQPPQHVYQQQSHNQMYPTQYN